MYRNATHEMPEPTPGFTTPSPEEIRRHVARGKQLQAEVMAESIVWVFDRLIRLPRRITEAFTRQIRRSATRRALMSCSDRVLADIGIAREDIPLVARASAAQPAGQPASHWRALAERVAATGARRRKRLQVYRELMGYSDRELDELGIRRRDIGAIARTA
ncbi:MAG: DUF1127 domain-containing protein [Geminicoccaceae bacterium]